MTNDFRCAPWTRELGPDPIGTTPRFDRLVLVETPLPWPSDVSEMPSLGAAAQLDPLCRVMAVVPALSTAAGALVTVWTRVDGRYAGVEGRVAAEELTRVLPEIVRGGAPATFATAPAEVLICGHGARDRCCGSLGTRLHAAASSRGWPVRVRRCSHLGGHRFAPTAMTMPEGRAWAHLDIDVLDAIVEQREPVADVIDRYRGSSALDPASQVLERAVFAELGWAWAGAADATVTDRGADGDEVELRVGDDARATGTVTVVREYPVLACGFAPNEATKKSPEYRLIDYAFTG